MYRCLLSGLIAALIVANTIAQYPSVPTMSNGQPSFDTLVTQANRIITDREEDVRRLSDTITSTNNRLLYDKVEIINYDQKIENELYVLQFISEHSNQANGRDYILIGNRSYSVETMKFDFNEREKNIQKMIRLKMEIMKELTAWYESIEKQESSLQRVNVQLDKAKAIMKDQQTRHDRAVQELAVAEMTQKTCPQGELLFASDTEIGHILGEIEVEVSTLEAWLAMWDDYSEINLTNIEYVSEGRTKDKGINDEKK